MEESADEHEEEKEKKKRRSDPTHYAVAATNWQRAVRSVGRPVVLDRTGIGGSC